MARTKAFNPQEKLAIAMFQFWQHGYDGTSMQGLVEAMGINRFSIYNTFGGKDELFFKSLQLYSECVFEPLLVPLNSDKSGLQRIQHYFVNLVEKLDSGSVRAGCFLQNAIQETAVTNAEVRPYVASLFDQLRQGFRLALVDALDEKALSRVADVDGAAEFLLMQVQALIVLQRQVSGEQLKSNVQFLLSDINAW